MRRMGRISAEGEWNADEADGDGFSRKRKWNADEADGTDFRGREMERG
jgi:hypothetical protein